MDGANKEGEKKGGSFLEWKEEETNEGGVESG